MTIAECEEKIEKLEKELEEAIRDDEGSNTVINLSDDLWEANQLLDKLKQEIMS